MLLMLVRRDGGRAFFGMLAPLAQFETDVRRDRQMDGIARVKADPKLRGQKYTGRKPIAAEVAEQVRALTAEKRGPSYIAATFGISRMSVHRILQAPRISP